MNNDINTFVINKSEFQFYKKLRQAQKSSFFVLVVVSSMILFLNCSTNESNNNESISIEPITIEKQNKNDQGVNMSNNNANLPFDMLDQNKSFTAILKTNKGSMTLELFTSESPITVSNFVSLSKSGFYDNVIFHRVIQDFMVQGGDPDGTGRGGPGYKFADELSNTQPPLNRRYLRGTLAMANSGPNTNGSQFFIVHKDAALPSNYTIFGQLTEGLDTLDTIASTPVALGASGESSSPTEEIIIQSIEITEN